MTQHTWDTVIIGGGAAGLSAAQALGRSLRRVLVIDAGTPRNRFAAHMHNVLGFDGAPPAELEARGRAEAERYGVEFREGIVERVIDIGSSGSSGGSGALGGGLRVELAGGAVTARTLIVASGLADHLPEIPGLAEHWGSSVLHCPYCHGWEVRGQRLAVIPHPDHGVRQAKLLRQLSEHVTLFTHGLDTDGGLDEETVSALQGRGIVLESEPVLELVGEVGHSGEAGQLRAVRTTSGREIPIDAVFVAGRLQPRDEFLADLALDRGEGAMSPFIAADPTGRTSHPRIWGVGNVVHPGATVPMAVADGNLAGATVNWFLVEEDFAAATDPEPTPATETASPTEFWEQLYSGDGPRWSGRANQAIAEIVAGWSPGRSLDLGCGEGGDVLWLAERGWRARGLDLSATAIARAREQAEARGLAQDRASFAVGDLAAWAGEDPAAAARFELITASFLQSPVELPRAEILRAAAARLVPGGHLVVLAHASAPSGAYASGPSGAPSPAQRGHAHTDFPSPDDEVAMLSLDPEQYEVEVAEVRTRQGQTPDGENALFEDSVVVVRRR